MIGPRSIVGWLGLGVIVVVALCVAERASSGLRHWVTGAVVTPVALLAPPYLHTGDRIPRTAFHPGEPVFVHVTTQRAVACFAIIDQRVVSFVNQDDHHTLTIWTDYHDSHGYTEAGTFESDYYFLTPNLAPGRYYYERTATYDCTGIGVVHQAQPLIPFEIVN